MTMNTRVEPDFGNEPVALESLGLPGNYETGNIFENPARFMNRELSWLEFNRRVLEEAENAANPLLERVRFLSISANNLDEFMMVRVAGLINQVRQGIDLRSPDGLTPREQLASVGEAIGHLQADQQNVWSVLDELLEQAGIIVAHPRELKKADIVWLEEFFMESIFPVLTPLSVDPAHPFPFIPNLGSVLVFDLKSLRDGEAMPALLRLPSGLRRFVEMPARRDKKTIFISIEEVVGLFIGKLFHGYTVAGSGNFRVIRDSDIEMEEEAEDIVRTFETALKRRRRGSVIRLEIDSGMPASLQAFVREELANESTQIAVLGGMLALHNLSEIVAIDRPELKFPPYIPRYPERVREMQWRLFCSNSAKGHHCPSPLRILRCRGPVYPPGCQ